MEKAEGLVSSIAAVLSYLQLLSKHLLEKKVVALPCSASWQGWTSPGERRARAGQGLPEPAQIACDSLWSLSLLELHVQPRYRKNSTWWKDRMETIILIWFCKSLKTQFHFILERNWEVESVRAQTSPQSNCQLCQNSFHLDLVSSGKWSSSCLQQQCLSCLLQILTKCGKKSSWGSSAVAHLGGETRELRPASEMCPLSHLWDGCSFSFLPSVFAHCLTHKCQRLLQFPEVLVSQLRNIPLTNPGQHYPRLGFHLCDLLQGCMGEHYVSTWFMEEIHKPAQIKQDSLSEFYAILSSRFKFTPSWIRLESDEMSLMNETHPLPGMQLIPPFRHVHHRRAEGFAL